MWCQSPRSSLICLLKWQMAVTSNIQAVAATAGAAITALLRGASRAQLERCSGAARNLVHCYLYLSVMIPPGSWSEILDKVWQRATEFPSSLSAVVDALQVSPYALYPEGQPSCFGVLQFQELCRVGQLK